MPFSTISSIIPRALARRHTVANEPMPQLIKQSPTEALLYYSTPGISPPSARIDPKLKLAQRRPPRFWEYWKFAAAAATKATHITSEVLSHKIWGPRRKTWGIEMTIVTGMIREIEIHADLVDINVVRMIMGLTGLAPQPSDAIVTPVTFHVKRRSLRGILSDFDAAETGERQLHGEWVVGRKTWQRLQHEWKSGSMPRAEGDSPRTTPKRKERVILYIHGGAYYLSSAAAQRIISIPLSKWADARVLALDYRLAPETCFPGPLHDAVSAYFRLVEDLSIPPENIVLAGDSAGGGLALALLLYLRDNKYPLPSGAILMSPWCDLTLSCESWDLNSAFDVVPFPANNHMNPIALYLGEHMEEYLTHPYVSPLFGDMTGLPPLLIQAGEAEVLRDEIALLAHKATLAGVEVIHELYEDCIHVFQSYPFLDASKQAFGSIRHFVKHILPQIQSCSPQLLPESAERGLEKEFKNSTSVLVRGDGAEMETGEKDLQAFQKSSSSTSLDHTSDDDSDKEVSPSWVHSPGLSRNKHPEVYAAGTKDKGRSTEAAAAKENIIPLEKVSTMPSTSPLDSAPNNRLRSRSQTLLQPVRSSSPTRPKARPQRSHHTLRPSALPMSVSQNPPPPPAIRRSAKSSHPDLTSLVDDWSKGGPANHTYLYPANAQPTHSS